MNQNLLTHIDALILELKLNYKEAGKALIDAATRNGYRDTPGSNSIKAVLSSQSGSNVTSNENNEKKNPQKNIPTVDPKLNIDTTVKTPIESKESKADKPNELSTS